MTTDKPHSPRRGRPANPDKPTDAERKAKSRAGQKAFLGFVQVNVVVPEHNAQDVRDFARRLREEHLAQINKGED